jgi:tetratricopeptide (TPR) repeat protein
MMIEQHYDEEVLIALLDEQKADQHLESCSTCKAALNSIRQVTSALHEETVWDRRDLSEEPRPETRRALNAFASSVATEDAAAAPWAKALLARPASEWRAMVDAHPEWKTAGFVRKLIAAVDAINFTAPADAVDLMKIAVDVAEGLAGGGDRIAKLKATAWREYAYAVFYVGRHALALEALDQCDVILRNCLVADYDIANCFVTRSVVCGAIERLDEALDYSRRAAAIFRRFDDGARLGAALAAEANVLTRARRYREALALHLTVTNAKEVKPINRAVAAHNAAACYRELREFGEAKRLFSVTIELCDQYRFTSIRSTARWNLARVLMAEGNLDSALTSFLELRNEFEELGMAHAVALTSVDAAEALLTLERPSEVVSLCRYAISYFENAELTYTRGALTALAFLREAAETETLTLRQISDIRVFFELLPKQPELLFARPA